MSAAPCKGLWGRGELPFAPCVPRRNYKDLRAHSKALQVNSSSGEGKCHGRTSPSPPAPPLLSCALWQPQPVWHWEPERAPKLEGAVSSALLGGCSHSQNRAHPTSLSINVNKPCPLQEIAPCCCACFWGHHSVDSDSPYIQHSCNAWKPSSSTDPSLLCHPHPDPPLAPSNISHMHSDAVFRSWLSEQPDRNNCSDRLLRTTMTIWFKTTKSCLDKIAGWLKTE